MEIDIPDLQDLEFEDRCYGCRGTGRSYVGVKKVIPEGKKRALNKPIYGTCVICFGTGTSITRVGAKLLEFLQKYWVKS